MIGSYAIDSETRKRKREMDGVHGESVGGGGRIISSFEKEKKQKRGHVVCLPCPAPSHISVMLKLAKLLHQHARFRITFVNTEFNHARFLSSSSHSSFFSTGLDDFQFVTIPDGLLPPSDPDANQDVPELCEATRTFMPLPFSRLIAALLETSSDEPRGVSCIISDCFMSFAATPAAWQFNVPLLFFWAVSASSFLPPKHYRAIKDKLRPLAPPKDASSYEENTFLDTVIDWVPGMTCMRVRDLPNSFGTKDGDNNFLLNFVLDVVQNTTDRNPTPPVIFHSFEALERDALNALSSIFTHIYAIGPLHLLLNQVVDVDDRSHGMKQIKGQLWKENTECLRWLESQEPKSVIYVNFGSIAFLTQEQLVEFAMGLANSMQPFLWIVRPDLVNQGDGTSAIAVLPHEFLEETKERGLISGWCPQEEVLKHPSIGGFLTHSGWNSIMESLSAGVPMLCWPCFGDQKGNCRYVCSEWEMGLEIGSDVKRDDVARLVRKLITNEGDDDEVGKKLRKRAMDWKRMAHEAALGSSTLDFNKLVNYITSIQR